MLKKKSILLFSFKGHVEKLLVTSQGHVTANKAFIENCYLEI